MKSNPFDYGSLLTQTITMPAVVTAAYFLQNFHVTSNYSISNLRLYNAPLASLHELKLYVAYILFAFSLYILLPGRYVWGPIFPSGAKYEYKINSFHALNVTLLSWTVASYFGWVEPDYFVKHAGELFVSGFYIALFVQLLAYVKGRWAPSNADHRRTGHVLSDIFSGLEYAPRCGLRGIDLKLFFVGHVGMILWALVNLQCLFASLLSGHNMISNACLNVMQLIYIYDWAIKEEWYLHTIDIKQDRFGFIFIFGSLVWMLVVYTTYAQYLASLSSPNRDPVMSVVYLALYIALYIVWRWCNDQKDAFRRSKGNLRFWGKKLEGIRATYTTADGVTHSTLLLSSGFWGISRHFNYFLDMLMCATMSCLVGFDSLVPHAYTIFMTLLLVYRATRDDLKCRSKYGIAWAQYCERVPYQIFPYVY